MGYLLFAFCTGTIVVCDAFLFYFSDCNVFYIYDFVCFCCCFFDSGFGSRAAGTDIGNISNVEGTPIVSNFGVESPAVTLGDFDGRTMEQEDIPKAFKLHPLETSPSQTSIFNEAQYNPIYIVIYTRGHKKVAWPVNTDERKRKYSIFKISSDDLFQKENNFFVGLTYQVNFDSPTTVSYTHLTLPTKA